MELWVGAAHDAPQKRVVWAAALAIVGEQDLGFE